MGLLEDLVPAKNKLVFTQPTTCDDVDSCYLNFVPMMLLVNLSKT